MWRGFSSFNVNCWGKAMPKSMPPVNEVKVYLLMYFSIVILACAVNYVCILEGLLDFTECNVIGKVNLLAPMPGCSHLYMFSNWRRERR